MTTAVAAAFPELSRAEASALEASLLRAASWAGAAEPLTAVRRRPLEGTWYRTEAVTAELATGIAVTCFVKDFGDFASPKSRMDERRERELTFYRDVFSGGEVGLARFAGEVARPAGTWLVLEHLEAVPLAWCGLERWHDAAAWLGRFHSELDRRGVETLPAAFKRRGREYFDAALARARAAAGGFGGEVRERVEEVAGRYATAVDALLTHPQTLVHGAFRPGQVLAAAGPPGRICPVDWEIAGVGSCLYDLAILADGFDDDGRRAFFDRYAAESPWDHLTSGDLAEAAIACRMHRTLKWIGHAHDRGIPADEVRVLAESLPAADGART